MRKSGALASRIVLVGTATALVIGASAGAALALGTTWAVSPGGAFSATAGTITLRDTTTGTVVTCASSAAAGTLKAGSGLPGTGIGTISSLTLSGCQLTKPLLSPKPSVTVTDKFFPWQLNALSYTAKTGTTTANIGGIVAAVSAVTPPPGHLNCTAIVNGTAATANNGVLKVTYTNSTGKLKVLAAGGNLHLYDPGPNCLGAIGNGDATTISGTYTVSPKQTITGT